MKIVSFGEKRKLFYIVLSIDCHFGDHSMKNNLPTVVCLDLYPSFCKRAGVQNKEEP